MSHLQEYGKSDLIAPEVKQAGYSSVVNIVDAFLNSRFSLSTKRIYSGYIRSLFDAVGGKELREVTSDDVLLYLNGLSGRCAPTTVASRLCVLRSFFQFCVDRGFLEQNPVRDIELPATLEYSSAVRLTEDQAEVLLRQPNRFTLVGKRDYALLCLMIYNGLFASEVVDIRWGDFQWEGKQVTLKLRHKGRKDSTMTIKHHLVEAILDYKAACTRTFDGATFLFTAVEANTGTELQKPISTETVRRIVKKYAEKAKLKKPVSSETLRRTYKAFFCSKG